MGEVSSLTIYFDKTARKEVAAAGSVSAVKSSLSYTKVKSDSCHGTTTEYRCFWNKFVACNAIMITENGFVLLQ